MNATLIPHSRRYLLFTYGYYYPSGGMCDYRGSFETIDEALKVYQRLKAGDEYYTEFGHVWDIIDEKVVYATEQEYHDGPRPDTKVLSINPNNFYNS